MASIRVILRAKKNKDGKQPIALQFIKDRKNNIVHIGHAIHETDWDEAKGRVRKSHPNSQRLNNLIKKKLVEAEDNLIELEAKKKDTTAKAIKNTMKPKKEATFFPQAEEYLDNLTKGGKYNRLSAEEPRIRRFKEFLQDEDIPFSEITVSLLNRYRGYLKSTRTIGERTVVNHLVVIRSIYNQAIKGNLVDARHYPFGSNKIQIKFPDSIKIGLVPEEIKILEELELPDVRMHHARNIWLFAFYFAGMRVSDVFRLRWSDIQNGRLYYSMGKNNKGGSLKIPEKALAILLCYEVEKDETDLVFPELKSFESLDDLYHVQMRIKTKVAAINKALQDVKKKAGLTKSLTMHIPRHSFGNISGDKIPVQMLQKLYRHSSITTTIGYQANFIYKDADDALEAVVG